VRMARDGHGLPGVSLGPAMRNPSMPWGRPPLALQPFQGSPPAVWAACDHLLPFWTAHAVLLSICATIFGVFWSVGFKLRDAEKGRKKNPARDSRRCEVRGGGASKSEKIRWRG
jgi:hypothetical protein